MKQLIQKISLFLIISVFLTGTTGVSFYIHECNSRQTREVFVFPEITNNTVACCCAEELKRLNPSDETVSSFNEPECCKNTHVYLKASFTGFPVFYQFGEQLLQTALPADFLNLSINDRNLATVDYTLLVDHPPPRSGKALVHFLHQIKIPASVS